MHSRVSSYLSNAVSAPIVAVPVFAILSILDVARPIHFAEAMVFGTLLPIAGLVTIARIEGFEYDVPERRARAKPFLVAIASYVTGFWVLVLSGAPFLLSALMFAYAVNTSLMFMITFFWKISVHAAGITGPLTFLVFRLGVLWGFLYMLVVPVGFIRFRMGKHSISQIVAGAVFSAALTWADIILLTQLVPSL